MFKSKKIISIFSALLMLLQVSTPLAFADEFIITGNGAGSDSEVVVESSNTTSIQQSNNGQVDNNVDTSANTGGNEIEDSSGSSNIDTGNVQSNTNVENAMNSSSVVNNTCCDSEGLDLKIDGNGTNSTNSISVNSSNESHVSISQNANISNDVQGSGNTGNNKIKDNLGQASIETGNIVANSGIDNGPVNVEQVSGGSSSPSLFASISENGSGSENLISALINDLANINVRNNANIANKSVWDLNTGGNEIDGNNGNASIKTGGIFLDILINNDPINSGGISWGCCKENPQNPPENPPSNPPSNPPGNGGNGGSGSSFSEILGTGGPAVLGLSNTSAILDSPIVFWAGILLIVFGVSILGSSLPQKKLRLNETT